MKYDTLMADFLEQLPEFKGRAEEEADLWRGRDYSKKDDPQGFFLFVLSLYMKENLPEIKDRQLYKRIFNFIESMAASDDHNVNRTLRFGILDKLIQYPENLNVVLPFMGEKARLLVDEIKKRKISDLEEFKRKYGV